MGLFTKHTKRVKLFMHFGRSFTKFVFGDLKTNFFPCKQQKRESSRWCHAYVYYILSL